MNIRGFKYRPTSALACLLGILAADNALVAQDLPEITVTSARMGHAAVTKQVTGHAPTTGAPIEHLTLTWSVAYSDLDLRQPGTAIELQRRIHSRAKAVCHELDRLFPLSPPGGASCAKTAADAAMLQAQKLIASAGARPAQDTR